MIKKLTLTIVVSAMLLPGGARAQSRPNPDDPAAPVAPTTHQSAFDGYRQYRDEPIAPWGDVNETVRRVGGHVGVLRDETQDAGPARPAARQPESAHGATPMGKQGGMREK